MPVISRGVAIFHDYAAEWSPGGARFSIDGQRVKTVAQAIAHPRQFILGLYEFSLNPGAELVARHYPKQVSVASVRSYRHQG